VSWLKTLITVAGVRRRPNPVRGAADQGGGGASFDFMQKKVEETLLPKRPCRRDSSDLEPGENGKENASGRRLVGREKEDRPKLSWENKKKLSGGGGGGAGRGAGEKKKGGRSVKRKWLSSWWRGETRAGGGKVEKIVRRKH